MRHRDTRLLALRRAARVLSLAPVVIAPHLIGGATSELAAVIAVMLVVGGFATLFAFPEADFPVGTRGVLGVCVALLLFTLLQALPIGCDLVDTLTQPSRSTAPRTVARLLDRAAYCAVSVDPGLTWSALLAGAACTLSFAIGAIFCASGRRSDVTLAVALSGAGLVASAFLHLAYDASAVYGVYTPVEGRALLGPLVNVNHVAGFCALTLPCMVAVALAASDTGARLTWLAFAAAAVVLSLVTLSRGGVGAMFIAIALVALTAAAKQKREKALLGPAAALVATLAATWFVLGGPVLREYLEDESGKLDLIAVGARHALAQGLFGHGRGAFGVAGVDVFTTSEWVHFAESFPVQWLGDYGLVFGSLAIAGFSFPVLRALRAEHHTTRRLAAVGLVAFGAQNLVDFGIELVGIAVVAAAALSIAASSGRPHAGEGAYETSRPRYLVFGLGFVVVALLVTGATRSAASARSGIERDLRAHRFEAVDAALVRALPLHPRDPGLALYAAAAARARDEDVTIAWLNHAMRTAPTWWSPHHEAALFFAQRRRWMQAAHEAKVVAERSVVHGRDLVCALSRAGMPLRYVARAAPSREPGAFLSHVSYCLTSETSAALQAHLLTWRVPPAFALEQGITASLSRGDTTTASALAAQGARLYPRSPTVTLARAALLAAQERPEEASRLIARAERLGASPRALALARAELYLRIRDVPRMRAALGSLRESAGSEPATLAEAEALAAGFERRAGSSAEAIKALERAYNLDGQITHLSAIFEIAKAEGWVARAEVARRRMCGVDPALPPCAGQN